MSLNTILATAPLTTSGYHIKANGTTLGNSLIWDNGTNVGIGNTNTSYTLDVSGTGRFTGMITSTVGNNAKIFDSASATTGYQYFQMSNSVGTMVLGVDNNAGTGLAINSLANAVVLNNSANAPLILGTNNTNRMTITSAGNVGIGTNSPDSKLQVAGSCKIDSALTCVSEIVLGSNGSYPVGGVGFRNDGTNLNIYYGANNCIFKDVTNVERMRITSGGQVQIKQSANTFADGFRLISSNSIYWGLVVGGDNNLYLGYNSPSASIGVFNYATGIYTATSDINKKKDFEDSTIGLNAILGLKPKLFRMKSENNEVEKSLGFIAQEVKEFIPQAYVDSNNFIGLNDRPIIAALVKAIQEMNTKLDEQNQLITSLQDRLDKAGL